MCVVGIAGIDSLILPAFEGSDSSACFTWDEQRVVSGCCGLGLGVHHHIR